VSTEPTTPEPIDGGPTEAELEAQITNVDPLAGPSPVKVKGNPRIGEPQITIFPQDVQNEIRARVANAHPSKQAELEQQLILERLQVQSRRFRVMVGPGEGATEYERELAEIANEYRLLDQEGAKIEAELAEKQTTTDEHGNTVELPLAAVRGDRRRALETRLLEIKSRAGVLLGREGEKRKIEALQRSKDHIRNTRQQLAEDAEARRLGEEQLRQERITKRAELYAKTRRSTIG
jgi:hypothetical protein